jgi:hypothetical protein
LATEIKLMLDEGVVPEVEDIDLCLILGAGWPFIDGGASPYLDREGASSARSATPSTTRRFAASAADTAGSVVTDSEERNGIGCRTSRHPIPFFMSASGGDAGAGSARGLCRPHAQIAGEAVALLDHETTEGPGASG